MTLPDDIAVRFVTTEAEIPYSLAALSAEERAQHDRFGSEKRRREFALGRTVARTLLAQRLGVAAPEVPLRIAADGAPELDGPAHLSIAHAVLPEQTIAVAAVAGRPIGVDLEPIRPRRPDLYRFLLHPDEYGLLERLPLGHDAAQVLIWTLKEAALKAMRTGFRTSPKKLRLTVDVGQSEATARVEEGASWSLRYAERDGCFFAIAF